MNKPPYSKKHLIIIVGLLLLAFIFLPYPCYQFNRLVCKPNSPCSSVGWHICPPLGRQIYQHFLLSVSTYGPPIETPSKSQILPPPYDKIKYPQDFFYCVSDGDCLLGNNCGQICFNKDNLSWYNENIGYCMFKPVRNVKCTCSNNQCKKISEKEIIIRGILSLRGSEPFTIIGLEAKNKENYSITSDSHFTELEKLAGQGNVQVEVQGVVTGKNINVTNFQVIKY